MIAIPKISSMFVAALVASGAGVPFAHAQELDVLDDPDFGPVRVRLVVAASGMGGVLEAINNDGPPGADFPTDLTALPDGTRRSLIMTLGGTIYILSATGELGEFHDLVDPDITEIRPRNFGPISIAAHPNFASDGRFYTIETEVERTGTADFGLGNDHQDVLYEYKMDDPSAMRLADTNFTKRELLRVDQPSFDHNMNDLVFLPDATMLVAIGDGANTTGTGGSGAQLRAPNLGSVLGKILRIDPLGSNSANGQYGIPLDNPFIGVPDAIVEIYSRGHRNPFRVSFDPVDARVWSGEVGQRTVEEANIIRPGGNYGWPQKEGSFLFGDEAGDANANGDIDPHDVALDPDLDGNGQGDFADANGLSDPIFEYDHGTGRSIAGGLVYRGKSIAALQGMYVFGDTDPREPAGLFYADPANGPVSGETGGILRLTVAPDGVPTPDGIVGFAQDHGGEILILATDGTVLGMVLDPCRADIDGDGDADADDFFAYLDLFASGDAGADIDGDGDIDADDFFGYLDLFAAGC